MSHSQEKQVVIIGAGPAGLTAAYELTKYNCQPIVLEQNDKVGGLARTENYQGYYFDMGGHRFYTKSRAVDQVWREILGADFLRRPRLSRIYYRNKFFNYPLKYANALAGLGIWQAVLIVLSFIKWQIRPYKQEETFEQWVTNRFGQRLYEIFFKTYTEKVWGIPCSELKAEWAAQRIKDLSFKTALLSMFAKPNNSIKTLIEEFDYPRLGPGMLWTEAKNEIERRGGRVCLNSQVTRIHRNGNCIESVRISHNGSGEEVIRGTDFISSMPVSEFIKKLDPVPPDVLAAANRLNYRDFLTVCLIVNKSDLFPDNWIYVHSPEVKIGRIQNYKNWSQEMVPDPNKTSLGLEYFCTEGDDLWNLPDAELVELGKMELERIGLVTPSDIVDGCVFRVPKAYPIYDSDYRDCLQTVKEFADSLENFQTIGRNGLHRYNNQDHSMITGMMAVRNLIFDENHDVWSVNTDPEYNEEIRSGKEKKADFGELLIDRVMPKFPRLDPIAFGLSTGIVGGLLLFLATIFLLLKDGAEVGPHLSLIAQFVPGYSATFTGGLLGLAYLLFFGFLIGSTFAYMRNVALFVKAKVIHRDIEHYLLKKLLDYI